MAEFDVYPKNLRSKASDLKTVKTQLNTSAAQVLEISRNLRFKGASSAIIRNKLSIVAQGINVERDNAGKLSTALDNLASCYEKHEKNIISSSKDGHISLAENVRQNPITIKPVTINPLAIKAKFKKSFVNKNQRTMRKGYYDKNGKWHNLTPPKDENGNDKKGYYDEKGKWHDGSDPNKKQKTVKDYISDVKIVNKGAKAEWMLHGDSYEGEHLSGSYKVLDFEAHADAYAGFFGFDDDGNKIFRPGIGTTFGVSATAFTAAGQAMIGDDMLGAYVGGDVTVGRAAAEGEVKIGIGKDGKFAAYAGGSAEAIAAEANVNVGAKVAGTDIKGKAGVNVGIGAHANAGYHDGKLSLDFGVAVGVGVSASLEIDFSGTMDKIANSEVGKAAAKGAKEVGKVVAEGAKEAGKAVAKGAKSIGKGAAKVGKAIAGWFD